MLFITISFAIFCAALAHEKIMISVSTEQILEFRRLAQTCGKEYGVDPKEFRKMTTWPLPEDLQFKKFLYCVFFNTGFITEDGHIVVEKAQTYTPLNATLDDTKKVYEKCRGMTKETYLDTMYEMANCFHQYLIPIINAPLSE